MFLYTITNLDYMVMTSLFGAFAIIAYSFRRKNLTSQQFLLATNNQFKNPIYNIIVNSGFGLPEFVLFTAVGAIIGLPAVCIFVTVYICVLILTQYLQSNSFNTVIEPKTSNIHQRYFALYYVIFLLLISATAVMTIVTLFKGLIAWEFGNSALSLMVVVGVCMLIGGFASVLYSRFLINIINLIIVIGLVLLAIHAIGISNVTVNLSKIASNEGLLANQFTKISFSQMTLKYCILAFFASWMIICANPFNLIKRDTTNSHKNKNISTILSILFMVGSLGLGVLALATPQPQINVGGKQFVTQQQKMEDGSLGYVVKLLPTNNPKLDLPVVSILPINKNIHYTFNQDEISKYDYTSAAMVLIKKITPYAFIPLVLLIGLFYRTISSSISFATMISINSFYLPYYNKTKEDLENLWAARVFMFMFFFIVVAIGLVFYKYFSYDFILGVLMIMTAPLLVAKILKPNWIALKVSSVFALLSILTTKISYVPSIWSLISYPSWWDFCLLISSVVFILCLVLTLIFNRVLHVK